MYNTKDFAERLRYLRKSKGLTQERLAQELHISVTHEGKLENGSRTPSVDLLVLISDYFSISLDYLLKGKNQPTDSVKKAVQEAIRELRRLESLLP
ncbi:MAG TPA: helix-turn-helix transcriptional regulator [Candidatus Faecousia faecipullorum]|nr:helix-turn-helix transcriptional regulator [Candidatus Faecousia faecipullorum]